MPTILESNVDLKSINLERTEDPWYLSFVAGIVDLMQTPLWFHKTEKEQCHNPEHFSLPQRLEFLQEATGWQCFTHNFSLSSLIRVGVQVLI